MTSTHPHSRRSTKPGSAITQPAKRRSPFVLPHFGQVRPQPLTCGLSVAVREFHQIGFAGEKTLAGNAGDEVLGDLHAVTGLGEFVAQMLPALGSGILLAHSNEANAGRLDESNQLIDFHPSAADQAPTRSQQ